MSSQNAWWADQNAETCSWNYISMWGVVESNRHHLALTRYMHALLQSCGNLTTSKPPRSVQNRNRSGKHKAKQKAAADAALRNAANSDPGRNC
jgi:hypothetical protein